MLKKGLIITLFVIGLAIAALNTDKKPDHGHEPDAFERLAKMVNSNTYSRAAPNKTITVHIIPHTHDDMGWLKTVEEYFVGANDTIAMAGVQYILDGIYTSLMQDPKKKFTYVEMGFFSMWWNEQTEEVKNDVKKLVKDGRLQFVNGGWSMSDESNENYEDFINNMKAGHDFLYKTFGYRPTIGWHIDPFGHQSAAAALFAEMGFTSWFFARGDYQDKEARMQNNALEWLWRPMYDNLGNRTEIFTHWLYDHYCYVPGFNVDDRFSGDSPIVDDEDLETYNVDEKLELMYTRVLDQASHYRTDNILVTFGCDFTYMNALKNFKNTDKLIKYMNEKYDDVNFIYSTPNDYIDSVHKADIAFPVKYDDMLPYASDKHEYWTGYYTSRANFKTFVRYASEDFTTQSLALALDSVLTHSEQESTSLMKAYNKFYQQMGTSQHHDAVSGTSKDHVMEDYSYNLYKAQQVFKDQFMKSMANLIGGIASQYEM